MNPESRGEAARMFDPLYEEELPPGQEVADDLPPDVRIVDEETVVSEGERAEKLMHLADKRSNERWRNAEEKLRDTVGPRVPAEKKKPAKNLEKPLGYDRKAQREGKRAADHRRGKKTSGIDKNEKGIDWSKKWD